MQNYCRIARALNLHNIKIYHIIGIPGSGSLSITKKLLESETATGGIMNLFADDAEHHYADVVDLKHFDRKLGQLWNMIFETKGKKNTKIEIKKGTYILRDWSSSFTSQEFVLLAALNNWSFIFADRTRSEQKELHKELLDLGKPKNLMDFEEGHILAWDNFHYFKHTCISLHVKFMLVKHNDIDWKKIYHWLKMKKGGIDSTKFDDAVKRSSLSSSYFYDIDDRGF